jgi:glycosyltransferase involved in cell wall biosynthesis
MRFWYPLADAVIAPSDGVGEDLIRHAAVAREQLHVIPNPIVNERLHALATAPLEDPWMHDRSVPVILGAGSLDPRKDFATLIRAFADLRTRRRARLVILGRGRERDRLLELARELGVADDVKLPGFEPNPYRWMARASVFALTSRREGSGAVLVEAMACGTPVVATDCPSGPGEILDSGRYGELVSVGDSEAVAAALRRSLDDPTPKALLDEAIAPFGVQRSARRYLQALGATGGGHA